MGMAVDASHGGVVVVAAQPVASAPPPVAVAKPVAPAPVPHTMMHGSMDGRMDEVTSGCYYQTSTPCCMMSYLSLSPDKSQYALGPMFCCCCCCWPVCPGCCGTQKVTAPGSSTYKGDSGTDVWTSPTTFLRTDRFGSNNEQHSKC